MDCVLYTITNFKDAAEYSKHWSYCSWSTHHAHLRLNLHRMLPQWCTGLQRGQADVAVTYSTAMEGVMRMRESLFDMARCSDRLMQDECGKKMI